MKILIAMSIFCLTIPNVELTVELCNRGGVMYDFLSLVVEGPRVDHGDQCPKGGEVTAENGSCLRAVART